MINAYVGRERPRGWSFLAHYWELIIVSLEERSTGRPLMEPPLPYLRDFRARAGTLLDRHPYELLQSQFLLRCTNTIAPYC